mmetsp:Transcript_779/g.2109  ORF Transcript_779/g.2109 Transcript_779/m.2109 type:complete len:223 (+) Transcript_779:164-832(+)
MCGMARNLTMLSRRERTVTSSLTSLTSYAQLGTSSNRGGHGLSAKHSVQSSHGGHWHRSTAPAGCARRALQRSAQHVHTSPSYSMLCRLRVRCESEEAAGGQGDGDVVGLFRRAKVDVEAAVLGQLPLRHMRGQCRVHDDRSAVGRASSREHRLVLVLEVHDGAVRVPEAGRAVLGPLPLLLPLHVSCHAHVLLHLRPAPVLVQPLPRGDARVLEHVVPEFR